MPNKKNLFYDVYFATDILCVHMYFYQLRTVKESNQQQEYLRCTQIKICCEEIVFLMPVPNSNGQRSSYDEKNQVCLSILPFLRHSVLNPYILEHSVNKPKTG